MGKFFLTISASIAQMERELISERTRASLDYKKYTLGHRLGQVPYGFQRIDGNLVEYPKEQKVLRKIKRLREKGLSLNKIANKLNEEGVPTRRKKNKKKNQEVKTEWRSSTIHHLINRKRVKK